MWSRGGVVWNESEVKIARYCAVFGIREKLDFPLSVTVHHRERSVGAISRLPYDETP